MAELFRIVDQGDPALGVATYNGGLFDPARHPFLEEMTVGDAHLQQAIDMLARVAVKQQSGGLKREFVDYRDLAVRHLGTIYEGLLEYHPAPASEDGWSVALLNEKGERKSSGSYYTPDYIVKYMVDQTLGPVLDAAVAGKETDAAKAEAVLALDVLDPAMGSGHFLVEATEYMARRLVELDVRLPGDEAREADIQYWRRRVASSSIYGVDLNPLAVELAKLSLWLATVSKDRPLSFLDHHLRAGNSLIGARLADLQLETAAGAPKKRAGNKREQKAAAAGQLSMLDVPGFQNDMRTAVGNMWLIEESPGLTIEQVKEQEQIYGRMRQDLTRRYGLLADLATARHFGLELNLDREQWQALADFATGRTVAILPRFQAWLDQAAQLSAERRFFHWELEFPEVFFDRFGGHKGDAAGFDAVIGNPPYVRQEGLRDQKPYFEAAYPDIYQGTADLFVYFIGQGIRQLRQGGRLAYISSNSWLRNSYAIPLRRYLRTQVTIDTLLDLGDTHIFADARDVRPAITVVCKEIPSADHTALGAAFTRQIRLDNFAAEVAAAVAPITIHDQIDTGWQVSVDVDRQVFQKLLTAEHTLSELLEGKMYRGVLTGLTEAFIVDDTTKDDLLRADSATSTMLRHVFRGQDLRPWYQEDVGLWLILVPAGWTARTFGPGLTEQEAWDAFLANYPALARHLMPYADAARKRQDKGQYWWELRSCDYYEEFDKPKILWPDMAKHPRFSWDTSGAFINNLGYFTPVEEPWILGLLNSRTSWFVITQTSLGFGERAGLSFFRLFTQQLARLPVPETTEADRQSVGALSIQITSVANQRYTLHTRVRRRILTDLGAPGKSLNQKLTSWWELDFGGLRR